MNYKITKTLGKVLYILKLNICTYTFLFIFNINKQAMQIIFIALTVFLAAGLQKKTDIYPYLITSSIHVEI